MRKALFFIVLFVFVTSLFASNAELESIRQAIEESGAKWHAGITPISILSKEERRMRLGWLKEYDPTPEERGMWPAFPPNRTYAESLDWRDYNGVNYITPIRDQSSCGSCVCFGALGAMEGMMNIDAGCENLTTDMSEQELLSCLGGSCSGWWVAGVMEDLLNYGVSEESCFPYEANDAVPCDDRCDSYMYTNRKVQYWSYCYPYVWGLKDAMQNGPITVTFDVYGDFFSYDSGVYEHLTGGYEGGHCVTMVGWNDADSCWICKNSWGPSFGEDGYFRIKWGECAIENGSAWMTVRPAGYPKFSFIDKTVNDYIGDGDGVLNPGEQAKLVVTIKNDAGWSDAQYVEAVLICDDPRISIIDSTANFGTMTSGQTKSNSSEPFEVIALVDTCFDPIDMKIYITAVGDNGACWVELPFDIKYGWSQYGWPVLSWRVRTSPAVVDLDNNHLLEIVYGTDDGNLFARKYNGIDLSGFPYTVSNKIWGSPAVGDVDNDGAKEIAFTGYNTEIYLLDRDGNLEWNVITGGQVMATPVLSDLNDDDELEVIVGSFDKNLYVLKSDGTPFNGNFPLAIPDASMIAVGCAVGDIDGDNTKEIIVGTLGGNVYAISPAGVVLAGWPFYTGGSIWGAPSIANLDGSGVKIVVGSTDDSLYVINSDGSLDWSVGTSGDIKSSPSFVDADGDGDLEIFFGSNDDYVYAYHHTGVALTGWPIDVGSDVRSQVVFSDLDNDDLPEIIVTAEAGHLYVFEGDGSIYTSYSTAVSPGTPAVEDIDVDRDLEIFFGHNEGVSAIDCKEQRGYGTYWNMFRCNPMRTGNYADAYAGIEEEEEDVTLVSVFKVYPNPFKGSAKIVFSCKKGQQINISIYNVAGQKVRSIESKGKETYREVNWDGRNSDNRSVPTGVYFCVAKTAKGEEIAKRKFVKIE